MNNDPMGTPNPLNPVPERSTPTNATSNQNLAGVNRPALNNQPAQMSQPKMDTQTTPPQAQTVTVESLDPTGRKMEQVPNFTDDKPKKKKTGLIAGIIIGALVICGGAAGLIWWLIATGFNPVEKAFTNVLNGESPAYTTISGNMKIESAAADQFSIIDKLTIQYTAKVDNSELSSQKPVTATDLSATITASGEGIGEISADLGLIYSKNNNLYLKIDGLIDAIDAMMPVEDATECTVESDTNCPREVEKICTGEECIEAISTTNCIGDSDTNCATVTANDDSASLLMSIFDNIFSDTEATWLKISADDLSMLTPDMQTYDNTIGCIANLANSPVPSSTLLDAYKQNRFIHVTTNDLPIASSGNTLYRIGIDGQNLTNFANAVNGTDFMYNIYSCFGASNISAITTDDVNSVLADLPAIYAEVDKNDRFSRIYMELYDENSNLNFTADIAINYPASLDIQEPRDVETIELAEVFNNIIDNIQRELLNGIDTSGFEFPEINIPEINIPGGNFQDILPIIKD